MESNISMTSFHDHVRILFRQKAVILAAILTVTVTVFIGLKFKTPAYEAQVKVLVSSQKQVESTYYRDLAPNRSTEITLTQGEIVKSSPVIEQAVTSLALYNRPFDYEAKYCSTLKKPWVQMQAGIREKHFKGLSKQMKDYYLFRMAVESLKKNVKVETIPDTNTFTISVQDFDPVAAATIANTVSRAYLLYDLQQQIGELQLRYGAKHPTVIQLQNNIAELAKTLHGQPVSIADALGTGSSKILEQAKVPMERGGISEPLIFTLGFIMSIFLGVMLAFVCEYMDHTFRTSSEIESSLGLPFLGAVPKKNALKPQAFQTLAHQVYLLMKDKNLKSVMIAGVDASGSSTMIAAGLAKEMSAQFSRKVLLIDADMRGFKSRPKFQEIFKIPDGPGLAEILEGKAAFEACAKNGSALTVLAAGKTALNPVTLIESSAMQALLKTVKEKFDTILFNVPPLIPHRDGEMLSLYMDGTVLVVTEGKTRRLVAQTAIQPLRNRKENLMGVVLNDRTFVIPKFFYDRVS